MRALAVAIIVLCAQSARAATTTLYEDLFRRFTEEFNKDNLIGPATLSLKGTVKDGNSILFYYDVAGGDLLQTAECLPMIEGGYVCEFGAQEDPHHNSVVFVK